MKKIILGCVILGFFCAGVVTVFLLLQKDESKVAETVSNGAENKQGSVEESVAAKTGRFNYLDPLHYGEGNVEIIDLGEFYKIKMLSNFKSADAPDPYVYLSSGQDFKDRAVGGVDTSKTLNLGKLKSFAGEQEYLVSKKDFEEHSSAVIIWCKKFGVQISRADLK